MNCIFRMMAVAMAFSAVACGQAWAVNEGQDELDRATEASLNVSSLADLDEVIRLTDNAMKAGLDEGNTQFAKGLLASTLAQRGAVKAAVLFKNTEGDPRLAEVRKAAQADLDRSVEIDPKQAQAWLVLSQLHRMPGGDEKRAAEALEKAIANSDDNPEMKVKGLLLRAALSEDNDKKIADLNEAIKLAPSEVSAIRTRGLVLADLGKYDQALTDLNRAIELEPQHGPTYEAKALVLARQKKYDEALVCLDQAQQASPQSIGPLLQKARIHSLQGNAKAALMDVEQARKIDGKNPAVLIFRAGLEDDPAKKLASLDEAVRLAPKNLLALRTRGLLRADQGKIDEGLQDLDKAIQLDPQETSSLEAKALVLNKAKRYEEALKVIDALLKIDPDLLTAFQLRAMILSESGKEAEAVAELEKLVKDKPENVNALLQLAMFHVTKKRSAKAIEVYNQVLAKKPEEFAALRGRGDSYLNIGKQAEALADYEKAFKLRPDDSGLLNNLAWVLCTSPDDKLRDGKRAIKLATEACELTDHKAAHMLSTLGAAYAETGDFATAIQWSEKALAIAEADEKESLAKELESYRANKPIREVLSEDVPAKEGKKP